jgi:IS5 family transposase
VHGAVDQRVSTLIVGHPLRQYRSKGAERALLAEAKVLRANRVRVDTTVAPANIAYPTDSGLLAKAIRRIGAAGNGSTTLECGPDDTAGPAGSRDTAPRDASVARPTGPRPDQTQRGSDHRCTR